MLHTVTVPSCQPAAKIRLSLDRVSVFVRLIPYGPSSHSSSKFSAGVLSLAPGELSNTQTLPLCNRTINRLPQRENYTAIILYIPRV
jgi:hypothetical protein